MWSMYDELLGKIPAGIKIKEIQQTSKWTMIACGELVGVAMRFSSKKELTLSKYLEADLKEVAGLIKSWDFEEASLGLAAINSYFNSQKKVETTAELLVNGYQDVLAELQLIPNDKKIGMIGHFPYVDRYPKVAKKLTIFELNPKEGDYPASASEFLLPQMDLVYITGSTLVNKTLPRLLQLSKKAQTVLLGASCPLSPVLFDYGVDVLAGTIYQQSLTQILAQKEMSEVQLPLSKFGRPIIVTRKEEQ